MILLLIDMDVKIVKRVPSYAVFNMTDMFGRAVYSTKNRYYIIDYEVGSIASIKKRYATYSQVLDIVYENR